MIWEIFYNQVPSLWVPSRAPGLPSSWPPALQPTLPACEGSPLASAAAATTGPRIDDGLVGPWEVSKNEFNQTD